MRSAVVDVQNTRRPAAWGCCLMSLSTSAENGSAPASGDRSRTSDLEVGPSELSHLSAEARATTCPWLRYPRRSAYCQDQAAVVNGPFSRPESCCGRSSVRNCRHGCRQKCRRFRSTLASCPGSARCNSRLHRGVVLSTLRALGHRAIGRIGEGRRHLLRRGRPQPGRSLDISEQQRHRAGRNKPAHTIIAPVQHRHVNARVNLAHASHHRSAAGCKHRHRRADSLPTTTTSTRIGR